MPDKIITVSATVANTTQLRVSEPIDVVIRNQNMTVDLYLTPHTRFTTNDGYVFLVGIKGPYNGSAENIQAKVDGNGNWSIHGHSGNANHDLVGWFRAVVY